MARLSVKRIVFVGIAVGCVLVLILAMSGVFRPAQPQDEPTAPGPQGNPGVIVLEKPSSQGEDWQMTAERAVILPTQEIQFVEPVIRYTQKPKSGVGPPRLIKVTADEGTSASAEATEVHLKNQVVVKMDKEAAKDSPAETATLRTDDLAWNKKTGFGRTPGPVRLDYTVEGKTYTVIGEGLTMDIRQRTARIERNVRFVLAGDVGLMSDVSLGASSPPPTAEENVKTVVECDGTLVAEEVTSNITLDKNVRVRRGDQLLRTDQLIVHIGKSAQGQTVVDQWQALGNVRLTSAKAEFKGTKLLRGADGYMTLIGNSPCSIKLEGMLIEGETISMDMQKGTVTVPGPGKLVMEARPKEAPPKEGETAAPPKEAPPKEGQPATAEAAVKPTTVTWTGRMDFDRKGGEAAFTKEVHVLGPDMEITCRFMTLWMTEDRADIDKLLAEGDVRLTTPQATATGSSVLYLMKEQRLELKGEPVATIEEQGHTVAASNIQIDQAAGKVTSNTPGTLTATLAPEQGSSEKRQAKVTWSSSMTYSEKEGEGRFEGKVAMKTATREITADSMNMKLTPPPQRDLLWIDAMGAVQINWEGRRGYAPDKFRWEANGGKGYLLGKPSVPALAGKPEVPAEPAAVATQLGYMKSDRIDFSDNFDKIEARGTSPVEASVKTGGRSPGPVLPAPK